MKTTKIIYWIATIAFCGLFTTTATLYFLHNPVMVHKFQVLGYPLYTLEIIGTAKYIGVVALLLPKMPRLKEWAYAGYAIDLVAGFWSHLAVQGFGGAIQMFVPMTLWAISYICFRRWQSDLASASRRSNVL